MSPDFEERLNEKLPKIIDRFGTPFHILDEKGIREACSRLSIAFAGFNKYRNFFAVKACPRFEVLKIVQSMGMGFDCSSPAELKMVREIGARPEDIIYTSNNTPLSEYVEALSYGGCILNLDDDSFIKKVTAIKEISGIPERLCLRYNPGDIRGGENEIIGEPTEQKYGTPHERIVAAYRLAKEAGVKYFWLHTMIASNTLKVDYIAETARMLLNVLVLLKKELGIEIEAINIGGGMGIPYYPNVDAFDIIGLTNKISQIMVDFSEKLGYVPRIVSEMGRYVTGPSGVLVTRCINKMHKYKTFIGVDASMSANPRPAIYSTPKEECYHHISVVDRTSGETEVVNVVGSLCENNDQFAKERVLPVINEGDPLIIQDTGAHALAMGGQYNARLLPQELLLREDDGSVERIKEAETYEDYVRTQRRAMTNPQILTF